MIEGKHIVLGVTGGIAAYKAVETASRLVKFGADVRVIMTRSAKEFVTELTFREISKNPVTSDMFAPVADWRVAHIALANLADAMLIAPATANVIAKAAHGIADDMLTTTLLATKAPVFFAPAMNTNMYENPVTQNNIQILKNRGFHIIDPASGRLACGATGAGRLPEPEELVRVLEDFFSDDLAGVRIIVTAAGTHEPIDPVRYIGNRSSGKMGYAIAEAAASRGADVTLISGPSAIDPPEGLHRFISVETALQMREAVLENFSEADIVIKAAAVADYRAAKISENKIKKDSDELVIRLEKNPDILKELGAKKKPGQVLVGFAAETEQLIKYASEKLEKKNLDFIVANDVTKPGAGFNTETNIVRIIAKDHAAEELPIMSKKELAKIILERAVKCLRDKQ